MTRRSSEGMALNNDCYHPSSFISNNMSEKMPKKDSPDSMEGLPRQDIPVEFVGDEEEKIEVKQTKAKKERVKRGERSL